eukprot:c17777_g1_i1 orf=383-1750(-)
MAAPLHASKTKLALTFLSFATIFIVCVSGAGSNLLGINYGTVADNLPPASEVVKLIQSTQFTKVKIYNADPDILTAFANTGIEIIIGIPNEQVGNFTNLAKAQQWVTDNVAAHLPATQIVLVTVGNEVLSTNNELLISQIVPVMVNLHTVLVSMGLDSQVKISSPNSLGILQNSVPPSSGSFLSGPSASLLGPMLSFLNQTGAPFMANVYPFFAYMSNPTPDVLAYALFTSTTGYTDPSTNLHYTNMFDAMLDAVYSAMAALGYKNIDIVVTETGWASAGDLNEKGADVQNAQTYNSNLMKHIQLNQGTPLRPNNFNQAYIFALFNEDLKPGPTSERNYGLFKPNMTPAYDVGEFEDKAPTASMINKWCVAKNDSNTEELQLTITYACGQGGADCKPIELNQPCYLPNTVESHASFAMNSYFQKQGGHPWDCTFNNTGVIVGEDPSYGSCVYLSP